MKYYFAKVIDFIECGGSTENCSFYDRGVFPFDKLLTQMMEDELREDGSYFFDYKKFIVDSELERITSCADKNYVRMMVYAELDIEENQLVAELMAKVNELAEEALKEFDWKIECEENYDWGVVEE